MKQFIKEHFDMGLDQFNDMCGKVFGGNPKNKLKKSYYPLPEITDVLSPSQIDKVEEYYRLHEDRVDKMMENEEVMCEPSENLDKNDPSLWKPQYWNWYFKDRWK